MKTRVAIGFVLLFALHRLLLILTWSFRALKKVTRKALDTHSRDS